MFSSRAIASAERSIELCSCCAAPGRCCCCCCCWWELLLLPAGCSGMALLLLLAAGWPGSAWPLLAILGRLHFGAVSSSSAQKDDQDASLPGRLCCICCRCACEPVGSVATSLNFRMDGTLGVGGLKLAVAHCSTSSMSGRATRAMCAVADAAHDMA